MPSADDQLSIAVAVVCIPVFLRLGSQSTDSNLPVLPRSVHGSCIYKPRLPPSQESGVSALLQFLRFSCIYATHMGRGVFRRSAMQAKRRVPSGPPNFAGSPLLIILCEHDLHLYRPNIFDSCLPSFFAELPNWTLHIGKGCFRRSATPLYLHKCVARFVSDS